MPDPMQTQQMGQSPQMQQLMSNPQLFAQLLQQMGAGGPNLQGPTQTQMPGQPPQGMSPGGQPGQPPQPPMPQGGQMPLPGGMPPQGMPPQGMQPPRPPMPPQGMPQGMPQGGPPGPIPQGQPGGPPQMQGGPQPPQMGGQPQMNPQMMQMIQQMMQRRQQGMQQPGMQQGGNKFTPQELGALGRFGDTTIAHMTPGEISVPPQVQTPKVLATLNKEYHKKGVDPSQFTVGSPQSSVNPRTGVPEYNFWSSILPMALGAAGGIFAGPLGAAAGSGIGNLAEGKDIGTSLLAAGLSGVGDYGAGQLLGGSGSVLDSITGSADAGASAGAAGDAAAGSPVTSIGQDAFPGAAGGPNAGFLGGGSSIGGGAGPTAASVGGAGGGSGASGASGGIFGNPSTTAALAPNPAALASMGNVSGNSPATNAGFWSGLMNNATTPGNWANVGGAAAGAGLGGLLGAANANPPQPSGFNTPYKNASQLPGWQTLMGKDTYTGPTANFTNYNPATNYPASFNFFPTATNQTTSS